MEPRGIRNNNFGNIRLSGDKWRGLCKEQTDSEFFQFIAPEWGYRALIRILQNYRRKHNCQTIEEFIKRWAPSHENNTGSYVMTVCRELQVPASFVPDVDNKETMCAFAAAISLVENGRPAQMADIKKGWDLL